MSVRFLARCEMVNRNNGIIQAMFVKPEGHGTQQWVAIINVECDPIEFTEGENYWLQVSPSLHAERPEGSGV
jgi:hypothetical protein